jgi:opacity protein-like surface antigen
MTHLRNSILAGAALILGASAGAQAADLYGGRQGGLKDYGYQQPAIASTPSIYLRIDGGIASFDRPHMVLDGTQDLTNTSIDRAWAVGGGIGTYFSQNVRGDITVDYRFKSDVKGSWLYDAGGADQAVVNGVNGLRSTVFLANAYY